MKTIYTLFIILLAISCHPDPKDDLEVNEIPEPVDYSQIDKELIEQYLFENALSAEVTNSGLYYIIENEGEGKRPSLSSITTVNYKGYLLNGEIFDQSPQEGVVFENLNDLIEGFKEGVLLLNESGKAILILPSRLAYGNYSTASIPENAVILFDIELLEVN